MLRGDNIALRTVRQSDLDALYARHVGIANRGDYMPSNFRSEPAYYKQFQETGLWGDDRGTLLIVNNQEKIVRRVMFFVTVPM